MPFSPNIFLSFSRQLNIPVVNKGLPHAVLEFRTKLLQICLWVSLNDIRITVPDERQGFRPDMRHEVLWRHA